MDRRATIDIGSALEALQRAGSLFRAGRYLQAAEVYREVIRRRPRLPDVHNNLGVALKAAGHLKDKRVVFNVGSALFRPLYRDFEYDEELAVDNNCGGAQRYNVQGRFDKPRLWKLASHHIKVTNLCLLTDVTVAEPCDKTEVTWKPEGVWDRTPDATLSITLQQIEADSSTANDIACLAKDVPYDARTAVVDLSGHRGKRCRIILRKNGDTETGGHSETFHIE